MADPDEESALQEALNLIEKVAREAAVPPPPSPPPPVDPHGGGGDDGAMEERLRAVEDRLLKLEVKADTFATKEDVRQLDATLRSAINDQTWKVVIAVVSWGSLAVGASFVIARYVH